jgi:uncharacterized DUF497 family protein
MDERFEFDPAKSAANRDKHGIDFVEAQGLWRVLALDQPLPYQGEPREMRTGRIGGRYWSAVYTRRGSAIRIISVRRARRDEEEDYERNVAKPRNDDEP